jgi:D-glycero-alpha-D-manno-heptose 1-phosphate guanylyltransferase
MEAIILAGGFGTRLNSRLVNLPKAMAPVAGRPFLEILMDQLIASGCSRIILSVGHLRQVILHAFREEYRGVPIDYAIEEEPLGTGGAIRFALGQAKEPSALVVNGDTYLSADYDAMLSLHREKARPMTMAVAYVQDIARYGGAIVEDGRVVSFLEKGKKGPGWINAGSYILSREFPWPEGLGARFSFETDVIAPYLSDLRPAAYRCTNNFLDIGIPEDLDRAQIEFRNQQST